MVRHRDHRGHRGGGGRKTEAERVPGRGAVPPPALSVAPCEPSPFMRRASDPSAGNTTCARCLSRSHRVHGEKRWGAHRHSGPSGLGALRDLCGDKTGRPPAGRGTCRYGWFATEITEATEEEVGGSLRRSGCRGGAPFLPPRSPWPRANPPLSCGEQATRPLGALWRQYPGRGRKPRKILMGATNAPYRMHVVTP